MSESAGKSSWLTRLRTLLLDITVVGLLALILGSILSSALSSSYSLAPIGTPQGFKGASSGEAISVAIRAEVSRLAKDAQTGVLVRPDVMSATEVGIKIAGTELPLHLVIRPLREQVIGLRYARITGDISLVDAGIHENRCADDGSRHDLQTGAFYRLTLYSDDRAGRVLFDCTAPYPALIAASARAILKAVDPYVTATLLTKLRLDRVVEARALVLESMADARRRELQPWIQRFVPKLESEVPRAHLALGYLALRGEDRNDAWAQFRAANYAFGKRSLFTRKWFAAEDGLSLVALIGAEGDTWRIGQGVTLARSALSQKPDFDAALYHLAETHDLRSGNTLRDRKHVTCTTIISYNEAVRRYMHLVWLHPTFAVGHDKLGTLRLAMLDFIREKSHDGCDKLAPSELTRIACGLADAADGDFAMATFFDPNADPHPWQQRGVLRLSQFHMRSSPEPIFCEKAADARREQYQLNKLLDEAAGFLRNSVRLKENDDYTWHQLAEALRLRRGVAFERGSASQSEEANAHFNFIRLGTEPAKVDAARNHLRELCLAVGCRADEAIVAFGP